MAFAGEAQQQLKDGEALHTAEGLLDGKPAKTILGTATLQHYSTRPIKGSAADMKTGLISCLKSCSFAS